MRRLATLAVLALAVAAAFTLPVRAAAGKDGDQQTATTLQPADKVNAEAAYRAARQGRLGSHYKFKGGLQLVVTAIEASTNDGAVPRFAIAIRTENRTAHTLTLPGADIACKNTKEEGNWYAESTWEPSITLRPKTFSEGTLVLGYPSVRYGEPVASCQRPVVRFAPTEVYLRGLPPAIQFGIPTRVVSDAKTAPERSG